MIASETLLAASVFIDDGIWMVLTATLVFGACGMLGSYLLLQRMSLVGDAISHAVLPGLVIAFMATGTRAPTAMLLGALAAGLVTVLLTHLIRRLGRVPEDASLGVVFTSLFALGVIGVSAVAHRIDLDPGCVLYGTLELSVLDSMPIAGVEVPRTALTMAVGALLVIAFVLLLWKELKLGAFDPQLASTLGINATLMHYLLMAFVAMITVAAFEAVGSILVVAALIAPAATAHLLTDRLWRMMVLVWVVGLMAALGGYLWAVQPSVNSSVSGMATVVVGLIFAVTVILAPRHGVISKRLHRAALGLRIVGEDVLALLYRWNEMNPDQPMPRREVLRALGGGMVPRLALWRLMRDGKLRSTNGSVALLQPGFDHGETLVRRHRLWETWLNKRFAVPPERVHPSADRMEHYFSDQLETQVVEEIGPHTADPHGRYIPRSDTTKMILGAAGLTDDAIGDAEDDDEDGASEHA